MSRGRTAEQTGVEGHGQYEYGYACNGCGQMSHNESDPCEPCDKNNAFVAAVTSRVRYREWTEFTPWYLGKRAHLVCVLR